MALGMIHWILKNDLQDQEYIDKYTTGFEGLRELVEPWTPEYTEEITTIPKEQIIEVAELYAKSRSHMSCGCGQQRYSNGNQVQRALASLAAVCGHIGKIKLLFHKDNDFIKRNKKAELSQQGHKTIVIALSLLNQKFNEISQKAEYNRNIIISRRWHRMFLEFDKTFIPMMEENSLDTVYIIGHMNPDGDACGCVMGLAHYIYRSYPQYKVIPYLSEKLDKGPKKQVHEDKVFKPFERKEAKTYAIIVCDTATKERMIDRDFFDNAVTSLVIDHHASNEGYGDINHTVVSEACSENIYHMLDKRTLEEAAKEAHPNVADYLYLGILHDTGCFHRANARILQVASHLLSIGADHDYVMKTFFSQTLADKEKEGLLLKMAKRTCDGNVAYIKISEEDKKNYDISYEDIHPIGSILRDCEDVRLGFTMFEEETDYWRCSFRSDKNWIDVNQLLEPFGGGGHASASGLRKYTKDADKLLEEIIEKVTVISSKAF